MFRHIPAWLCVNILLILQAVHMHTYAGGLKNATIKQKEHILMRFDQDTVALEMEFITSSMTTISVSCLIHHCISSKNIDHSCLDRINYEDVPTLIYDTLELFM